MNLLLLQLFFFFKKQKKRKKMTAFIEVQKVALSNLGEACLSGLSSADMVMQ